MSLEAEALVGIRGAQDVERRARAHASGRRRRATSASSSGPQLDGRQVRREVADGVEEGGEGVADRREGHRSQPRGTRRPSPVGSADGLPRLRLYDVEPCRGRGPAALAAAARRARRARLRHQRLHRARRRATTWSRSTTEARARAGTRSSTSSWPGGRASRSTARRSTPRPARASSCPTRARRARRRRRARHDRARHRRSRASRTGLAVGVDLPRAPHVDAGDWERRSRRRRRVWRRIPANGSLLYNLACFEARARAARRGDRAPARGARRRRGARARMGRRGRRPRPAARARGLPALTAAGRYGGHGRLHQAQPQAGLEDMALRVRPLARARVALRPRAARAARTPASALPDRAGLPYAVRPSARRAGGGLRRRQRRRPAQAGRRDLELGA